MTGSMPPLTSRTETTSEAEARLAEFERRHSPVGLFERYARGRVQHFVGRQVMTLSGACALYLLASPQLGLLAMVLALLGEAVDCLFLSLVPRLLSRGVSLRRLRALATVTAGIQGATIAACVVLAWVYAKGQVGTGFSLAYVAGASINAGIVMMFFRPAALIRIGLLWATVLVLLAREMLHTGFSHSAELSDVAAAMIVAYIIYAFVNFALVGQRGRAANLRDLLRRNIAQARSAEELREQQNEIRDLALVAEHANDSVIMSDAAGRILWVNQAFERITGYDFEQARGKLPADLLNGPDTSHEVSDAIGRAVAKGRPHRAELINYTADGRRIWIETNLVPVLAADGTVEKVIAIERDITAAKAHEAELADAKRAAEQGAEAKAQFMATMSHEIRTPMNGIIGMADLLSEADLTREDRHYVETIRQSGEALLTIINDILDFSRLDAGKMAVHAIEFDPSDCISSALAILRPQAADKGLFVDVENGGGLPGGAMGDDGRLRQIIINVVGNAIKFTERGGVTVRYSGKAQADGTLLRISVADTGIGISPDRLDHVFHEFEQADAATTRQFGGTGLGLSISRLLAREMDGDITVRSQPGQGSCFTISVVLGRTSPAAPDHVGPSSAPPPDRVDLDGRVVLVAEDNRTNRLLIRKYLDDVPVQLHFAENGRKAVEMVALHDPDIVLMDMSMPEMDGIEATRAIRASEGPQPHIVALTANVFASDKARCLNAGMNGFLTKPLRRADLLEALAGPVQNAPPPPEYGPEPEARPR